MFWLAFSHCNGIGPAKFDMLLDYFGTAEDAWNASASDLLASGIGKAAALHVIDFKKQFSAEGFFERLQNHNVEFLTLTDEAYPQLLKQTERPPFVIYMKGNSELLHPLQDKRRLAVVGTRKVTDYGRQVTEILVSELAEAGLIIVSGLALGVDAIAHTAALDVKGKTIAVLGSGVDYCTPRENQALYDRIVAYGGAIVSEVPLGYMPNKGSFPSRNRIIAGLSIGVLVTEGAQDSGSLITASNAETLQRKVFAVPGPITSAVSKGANLLITNGAKMVTSARDILQELKREGTMGAKQSMRIKGDSTEEQKIIDLLAVQNLHFDELVKQSGLSSSHTGTLLSLLEMKGVIQSLASGVFTLDNGS